MEILAVCYAGGLLPFWSWKRKEKCWEAKSISLNLCKISKTKLVTMSAASTFSLETFIFRWPMDFGVLVRSADGGRVCYAGCSSPSLEFSKCSPHAFEPQIDFWQVLAEKVVAVTRSVSWAIHGAGDIVRKEKHTEKELFLSSFSFVFNPSRSPQMPRVGSHL